MVILLAMVSGEKIFSMLSQLNFITGRNSSSEVLDQWFNPHSANVMYVNLHENEFGRL